MILMPWERRTDCTLYGLGIDRFMSEAQALINLVGHGVGGLVVAKWTGDQSGPHACMPEQRDVDTSAGAESAAQ